MNKYDYIMLAKRAVVAFCQDKNNPPSLRVIDKNHLSLRSQYINLDNRHKMFMINADKNCGYMVPPLFLVEVIENNKYCKVFLYGESNIRIYSPEQGVIASEETE